MTPDRNHLEPLLPPTERYSFSCPDSISAPLRYLPLPRALPRFAVVTVFVNLSTMPPQPPSYPPTLPVQALASQAVRYISTIALTPLSHAVGSGVAKPEKEKPSPVTPEYVEDDSKPRRNPPFLVTRRDRFYALFKSAYIESDGEFAITLGLAFVFAVFATLVSGMMFEAEQHVLARRRRRVHVTAAERIVVAGAHVLRMALAFVVIMLVSMNNVWVAVIMLLGHFVGWILLSGKRRPRRGDGGDDGDNDDKLDAAGEELVEASGLRLRGGRASRTKRKALDEEDDIGLQSMSSMSLGSAVDQGQEEKDSSRQRRDIDVDGDSNLSD